jgi:hypothetical protein
MRPRTSTLNVSVLQYTRNTSSRFHPYRVTVLNQEACTRHNLAIVEPSPVVRYRRRDNLITASVVKLSKLETSFKSSANMILQHNKQDTWQAYVIHTKSDLWWTGYLNVRYVSISPIQYCRYSVHIVYSVVLDMRQKTIRNV